MFTLIRPVCGILLALMAAHAASVFWPVARPDHPMGSFALWVGLIGLVIGWGFLGSRVGRQLWLSVFVAAQAVVLVALAAAAIFGVREVFILGYQRRYREPMEAVNGFFETALGWLALAIERDFLILLGIGALLVGVLAHLAHWLLERRRMAR